MNMPLDKGRAPKPSIARVRPWGAFTIVEIMIVVAIIALLATMAWPSYVRARMRAQNTRVINDLRVFAGAFDQYATETRGNAASYYWPADQNPGVFPTEMAGMIDVDRYQRGPAFGGQYDWDVGVFGVIASISIYEPHADEVQLQQMDAVFDNGDLASGAFRESSNRMLWVLQEAN